MERLCPRGPYPAHSAYPTLRKEREGWGTRTLRPSRGGSYYRQRFLCSTKAAKVPRLLVVGGAGSLEVRPGLTLVNTPDFPVAYKPETLAGVEYASIAIKWVVEEDGTDLALTLRQKAKLMAPDLTVAECANILWRAHHQRPHPVGFTW